MVHMHDLLEHFVTVCFCGSMWPFWRTVDAFHVTRLFAVNSMQDKHRPSRIPCTTLLPPIVLLQSRPCMS